MKEKLYTIPLMDAMRADDECPFCYIERSLEQNAIDFILGSAYMESDIREETDRRGFCRHHLSMMFQYGNSLGNALMLKTHCIKINEELTKEFKNFKPAKKSSFAGKLLKKSPDETASQKNSLSQFLAQKEKSCYLCDYNKNTYQRYLDTFFYLYQSNPEFIDLIRQGKGFCLHHLKDLIDQADFTLSEKEKETFYPMLFKLMEENMQRIQTDISWFVDKFDYRNKDADWKSSMDAIPRTMQKFVGGYPSDPPYKPRK